MEYFVYRHIRLDTNEVFYIGIGRKIENYNSFKSEYRRAFATRRNRQWSNIINKTDFDIEIVFESNDHDIIKQKEIEFIKLYGRSEGTWGYKFTQEQLEKLSKSHKSERPYRRGIKHSEEAKIRMSNSKKGKYKGENSALYGIPLLETTKIKLGTPVIQYSLNGEFIERFYSLKKASEDTGSDFRLIQKVCKGERKKHNGFKWAYEDLNNTKIQRNVIKSR